MLYAKAFFSVWRVLNSFENEPQSSSFDAKQTHTEPGKGKDFNQGKSTIERLMKQDQTK